MYKKQKIIQKKSDAYLEEYITDTGHKNFCTSIKTGDLTFGATMVK